MRAEKNEARKRERVEEKKRRKQKGNKNHEGRREKSSGKCISRHCEKDGEKEG